jgi:hypothetical protein
VTQKGFKKNEVYLLFFFERKTNRVGQCGLVPLDIQLRTITGEMKDWNKHFQEYVDLPEQTLEQKLQKFEKIREIAQNFERTGNRVVESHIYSLFFLSF